MRDGSTVKIDAEEEPGTVYDFPCKVTDWRFIVEMETE